MIQRLLRAEGMHALESPLYRRFAAGYAFSSMASWMQRVCFGWLAWELTQSPFWLGAIAFAEFLPILLISLLLGDLIDRYDKRRIILVCEALPALTLSLLLVIILLGLLTIPLLFLLAFAVGTSMAISHPTQLAWYPTLLRERTHIGSAANIYILSLNIARFAGAGLAGITISLFGIAAALCLTVSGYLIFVAALMSIPKSDGPAVSGIRGNALKGALDGIKYCVAHPQIGAMLVVIAITSAGVRGIPDLAPAITELQLQMPLEKFSTLIAATGLGSVIAGLWNIVARDHSLETAIRLTLGFSFALAVCAGAIAMTSEFWLALALFAALGFSITITAVKSQQVIQSMVDDTVRGRINALYFLTFRGGTAFGALWMGAVASMIGLMATILIGGLACFAVWLRYRTLSLGDAGSSTLVKGAS